MEMRKEVFRALVGSHNYGLQTENSDKDWKIFLIPTFDDLYNKEEFSQQVVGDTEDLDYHDVRALARLLWKANPAFLEVLYSKEVIVAPEFKEFVDLLYTNRKALSMMNLPYLFNAAKGMYFQKRKDMEKGTAGTRHLMEKYGYDTKCFLHAWRNVALAEYLVFNKFDFEGLFNYEMERKKIAENFRDGDFTLQEAYNFLDTCEKRMNQYAELFATYVPSENTKEWLDDKVRELVRKNLI